MVSKCFLIVVGPLSWSDYVFSSLLQLHVSSCTVDSSLPLYRLHSDLNLCNRTLETCQSNATSSTRLYPTLSNAGQQRTHEHRSKPWPWPGLCESPKKLTTDLDLFVAEKQEKRKTMKNANFITELGLFQKGMGPHNMPQTDVEQNGSNSYCHILSL